MALKETAKIVKAINNVGFCAQWDLVRTTTVSGSAGFNGMDGGGWTDVSVFLAFGGHGPIM